MARKPHTNLHGFGTRRLHHAVSFWKKKSKMQIDGDATEEGNYNAQPPKNPQAWLGTEEGREHNYAKTQPERGLNTNLTNTTKNH